MIRVLLLGCLLVLADGVLVGKLRRQEEPESNVVKTSWFFFPREEGDHCKTDIGLEGQCVDVRYCYAARRAIRTGNHPARCGWINDFIPMVCCHPEQVQHPKFVFRSNSNRRRYEQDR